MVQVNSSTFKRDGSPQMLRTNYLSVIRICEWQHFYDQLTNSWAIGHRLTSTTVYTLNSSLLINTDWNWHWNAHNHFVWLWIMRKSNRLLNRLLSVSVHSDKVSGSAVPSSTTFQAPVNPSHLIALHTNNCWIRYSFSSGYQRIIDRIYQMLDAEQAFCAFTLHIFSCTMVKVCIYIRYNMLASHLKSIYC